MGALEELDDVTLLKIKVKTLERAVELLIKAEIINATLDSLPSEDASELYRFAANVSARRFYARMIPSNPNNEH